MREPDFVPTPEMIAAAWAVLRDRWPGKPHLLGPGPGFREAITAAFRAMPAGTIPSVEKKETPP